MNYTVEQSYIVPEVLAGLDTLDQIRGHLRSNPEVFVAGELQPGLSHTHSETHLIVAPARPLFDPDELNKLMFKLVPGIAPTEIDLNMPYESAIGRYGIYLGRMYFSENKTRGTRPGHICLRMYPDSLSAHTIVRYEEGLISGTIEPNQCGDDFGYWITAEQLDAIKESYSSSLFNQFTRRVLVT